MVVITSFLWDRVVRNFNRSRYSRWRTVYWLVQMLVSKHRDWLNCSLEYKLGLGWKWMGSIDEKTTRIGARKPLPGQFCLEIFYDKTSHSEISENAMFFQSTSSRFEINCWHFDSINTRKRLSCNEYVRHSFDEISRSIEVSCRKTSQTEQWHFLRRALNICAYL